MAIWRKLSLVALLIVTSRASEAQEGWRDVLILPMGAGTARLDRIFDQSVTLKVRQELQAKGWRP